MAHKDFIALHDWTPAEIQELFELSARVKADKEAYRRSCAGQALGLYFEKSSTRTRVSFEVGIYELGGTGLFLGPRDLQVGRGETIADTARVLSRYLGGIMARTFGHDIVTELAKWATIPVINGLTDYNHPCQALTDYFTLLEKKKKLKGLKLAYVGDGNNVATSLAIGAAKTGVHFVAASPAGYQMRADVVEMARADARETGATIEVATDPAAAVRGADAVYTDVWASMGQEEEHAKRLQAFRGYQVDLALFAKAKPDAVFMHCLPAHHGEEVSREVCEHQRSVIFDEAENRLHCQKAIMVTLMGNRKGGKP
ncbi:MAG: ornithine carbamoyltransferase [Planctomycetota bacterium]